MTTPHTVDARVAVAIQLRPDLRRSMHTEKFACCAAWKGISYVTTWIALEPWMIGALSVWRCNVCNRNVPSHSLLTTVMSDRRELVWYVVVEDLSYLLCVKFERWRRCQGKESSVRPINVQTGAFFTYVFMHDAGWRNAKSVNEMQKKKVCVIITVHAC